MGVEIGHRLGREDVDGPMELRRPHQHLVLDGIDDARPAGEVAADLQVALDGVGFGLAGRPPVEMIAAQHQRPLAVGRHVVIGEVLARVLCAQQRHRGGIEGDGRLRPCGRNIGRRRHGRRAVRPHDLVADGVAHAAVDGADDRHLAMHGLVAFLEGDAARRRIVDAAHRDAQDAAHVDGHRLGALGRGVVLERPTAKIGDEGDIGGVVDPRAHDGRIEGRRRRRGRFGRAGWRRVPVRGVGAAATAAAGGAAGVAGGAAATWAGGGAELIFSCISHAPAIATTATAATPAATATRRDGALRTGGATVAATIGVLPPGVSR